MLSDLDMLGGGVIVLFAENVADHVLEAEWLAESVCDCVVVEVRDAEREIVADSDCDAVLELDAV